MPLYKIECPCGNTETYAHVRADWGGDVVCDECGTVCEVLIAAANFGGDLADRPITIKQVGKTFANARELDSWAAANDCEVVSRSSSTWKTLKEGARQGANEQAQTFGFNDVEEQREKTRHDKSFYEGLARDNKAQKIEAYHNTHGSDGRMSVEDAMEKRP